MVTTLVFAIVFFGSTSTLGSVFLGYIGITLTAHLMTSLIFSSFISTLIIDTTILKITELKNETEKNIALNEELEKLQQKIAQIEKNLMKLSRTWYKVKKHSFNT